MHLRLALFDVVNVVNVVTRRVKPFFAPKNFGHVRLRDSWLSGWGMVNIYHSNNIVIHSMYPNVRTYVCSWYLFLLLKMHGTLQSNMAAKSSIRQCFFFFSQLETFMGDVPATCLVSAGHWFFFRLERCKWPTICTPGSGRWGVDGQTKRPNG